MDCIRIDILSYFKTNFERNRLMMIFSVFTATDTSNFAMVDYSISSKSRNVVSAMRGENSFGIGIGTFWGNFWDFRGFVKFFGLLWDYLGDF